MKVIGFAGTAKNTGKTTAAAKVLSVLRENGKRVAVTSIGYDGENVDNVTGLPKPLYYLKSGDVIATAAQCLKVSKPSSYRLLEMTGIETILGQIQLVEILEDNTYTLAGPNRRTDLEQVLGRLAAFRADVTLVDGALNRIVPMICADGIVVSTGASFDEEIEITAEHIAGMAYLFTIQAHQGGRRHKHIHFQMADGSSASIHTASLITRESFEKIRAYLVKGVLRLTIPGVCYPEMLDALLEGLPQEAALSELVLGNPLFLIASGSPVEWKSVLLKYAAGGVKLSYSEKIPLLFVTVSPFYPRYIQNSHSYEPAYVDAQEILKKIRARIPDITVINVENISNQELFALLY